jgi:hypothetical protein
VRIQSTLGGKLRILSPWPRVTVRRKERVEEIKVDKQGIITLDTRQGEELKFEPKAAKQGRLVQPAALSVFNR